MHTCSSSVSSGEVWPGASSFSISDITVRFPFTSASSPRSFCSCSEKKKKKSHLDQFCSEDFSSLHSGPRIWALPVPSQKHHTLNEWPDSALLYLHRSLLLILVLQLLADRCELFWDTCSAESDTGPSLGWTAGGGFWVEAGGGAWACDWCVGAVTAGVSTVPFSGILWEMKAEGYSEMHSHLHVLIRWGTIQSEDSLTLFGVWIGDRASRSVIGNSKPLLLRSSYTYTTPAREGELRNASAHDWRWQREDMMRQSTQCKTKITCEKNKKTRKASWRENRKKQSTAFTGLSLSNVIIPASLWLHETAFDHPAEECMNPFKGRRTLKITLLEISVDTIELNLVNFKNCGISTPHWMFSWSRWRQKYRKQKSTPKD